MGGRERMFHVEHDEERVLEVAHQVFGERFALAQEYHRSLSTDGVEQTARNGKGETVR